MKKQSSQWKASTSWRPKKAQQVQSFFFLLGSWGGGAIEGILHKEFVPPGQMVNCDLPMQLRENIQCKLQTSDVTTPGPCIMTMLQFMHHLLSSSFWLLWTWQSYPTLPTHWTSPPVIFSYSQKWKWSSRGNILTALKRSRLNRRTLWRRWHTMTVSSASVHRNLSGNAEGDYFIGGGGE